MKLIDANVILRYLLKEPQDQSEKAKEDDVFPFDRKLAAVIASLPRHGPT